MLPPFDVDTTPLAPSFRLLLEAGVLDPSELFLLLLQLCPFLMLEGEADAGEAVAPFRGVSLLVGGGVAGTSGGVDGPLDSIAGEAERDWVGAPRLLWRSVSHGH